jgi:rhodanese-related sulfurtransferase
MKLLLLVSFFSAISLQAEEPRKEASATQQASVEPTHLTPEQAKKLMDENKAGVAAKKSTPLLVIDVRTPEEHALEKIAGTKNLNFQGDDFAEKVAKLDKSVPVLLHCRAGGRSTNSLEIFQKLGFTKLYHLDGGLEAWKKAGLATEKGK